LARSRSRNEGRCCGLSWHRYEAGKGLRCEGCSGWRNGGCTDARAGRSSGRSCRSRNRCRCGWMNGHRYEARSSSRSEGKSCSHNLTRSSGRCGRRNEGHIGGRNSPSRLGDRKKPDKAETRIQIPDVRTQEREGLAGPGTAPVYQRGTMDDARRKQAVLRFGVLVSLIPVKGVALSRATDAFGTVAGLDAAEPRVAGLTIGP